MSKMDKTEKEFTKDIDRLLAGEKTAEDGQKSEEYSAALNAAGRIIECRSEPSDAYKQELKKRLLLKLNEKERAAVDKRKAASGEKWFRTLFQRETTWRLVPVQMVLAIISLLAIWGIEYVSRPEPIVALPPGGRPIHELLFFWLGIANNLILILIFLIRRKRLALLKKSGWIYFVLAVPAIYGIVITVQSPVTMQYAIFLGIFLIFLLVEWLYDFVFKTDFRGNWKKNWKLLVPYLALYYAMNYGFIVMSWKISMQWGIIMIALFVIQLITNLASHPETGK
jgi:hypothetical protein